MTKKFDSLTEAYCGNMFPAMLADYARLLGVSEQSLARLDVGWAPIVQFKNGPNYQGWWTNPERTASGEPIGLSLRSLDGSFKAMYPGSKHGLIYPLNPNHERGARAYVPGRHNWIRTMDAGVDCPVCHKPDGCLVSNEDPDDPKAVICIRVKTGAERAAKFGYLHVRKQEGRIDKNATALPPSPYPVVIVEGMSDTAAVMDLDPDLVGVGRPSNLACIHELRDLVRGRDVVIVGENDDLDPTTGERPGHEGMVAAFQMLRTVCRGCTMVLPPDHIKDFRQWKATTHLTREEFDRYVKEHGRTTAEDIVLPNNKPLTVARAYLDANHRAGPRYTLRYHDQVWYTYAGTKYEPVDEESMIRGPLYGWCDDKYYTAKTPSGEVQVKPLPCTSSTVSNIMDAMLNPCPVTAPTVPCWINETVGPNPSDLIVFNNGMLHVPKYIEGADEDDYFLDLTPDFFTTFALPFAFDPTARCLEWRKFLLSTLGDDRDKIRLLQEWMGYCLTTDTSLHKLMMFRGPRRSGKGTVLHVLEQMVGSAQCAGITFRQLASRFGLEGLVGSQVAIMADARLPYKSDSMQALEVLLNIVGEDPVNIDRKFIKPLRNHHLRCKFTIATNELPELPDHAGALEARLNILDFSRSFLGREDFALRDKLSEEVPGITVWALEGLKRLREQGNRFTLPDDSQASLQEWRTTTSPVASFLEECCIESPAKEIKKDELFDAWKAWSTERGIRLWTKSKFFERLKAQSTCMRSDTYEHGGHKFSIFRGIKLKPWAERNLLGRP